MSLGNLSSTGLARRFRYDRGVHRKSFSSTDPTSFEVLSSGSAEGVNGPTAQGAGVALVAVAGVRKAQGPGGPSWEPNAVARTRGGRGSEQA